LGGEKRGRVVWKGGNKKSVKRVPVPLFFDGAPVRMKEERSRATFNTDTCPKKSARYEPGNISSDEREGETEGVCMRARKTWRSRRGVRYSLVSGARVRLWQGGSQCERGSFPAPLRKTKGGGL